MRRIQISESKTLLKVKAEGYLYMSQLMTLAINCRQETLFC